MAKKERLDKVLVDRGLVQSREKAKKLIMAGLVFVENEREDKVGAKIDPDADIFLKEDPNPYVSRGGLKLHKGIRQFNIELAHTVCMDVGASTGGFTDCMLQHGASKVYSVDVGYGQFDWSLRQDSRVVCLEKTNVRYITEEQIDEALDFFSVDVSFISLSKVLPACVSLLKESGSTLCLIKPQFEAGREKVGKKGVVRDPLTHVEVIEKIIDVFLENCLEPIGIDFSPITGPQGNIEYLIYGRKSSNIVFEEINDMNVKELVHRAHTELYRK